VPSWEAVFWKDPLLITTRERGATDSQFEATKKSTHELTGGQALVASLIANGVDTIFALPGVQLDGAFDALYEERDAIRVIHPRHEQAAAYMADGYARTTGKVGVCMVVPGPGLLNASAALSTAYACNSPVLCVTGQIQSDLIEFGRGLLHEIPNQLDMIRSVTKQAERATTPPEIPGLVQRAFAVVNSGRQRPVEIEIPPDTLFATAEVELLLPAEAPERFAGDPELLERAARLLANARRPLIWSGGGVLRSGAGDELLRLATRLQAPVVMTANGKGAISDRDPLAQNIVGGIELLRDADVVFAVGTRFVDPATAKWGVGPDQTIVQMDVDPEEIARNTPVNVDIVADARAGLSALADLLEREGPARPTRAEELAELKLGVAARARAVGPQAEYALAIREALPDQGIFVSEMTQVGYWANFAFPVYEPLTYITPGYQGTLGYGFPTALGAKIAHPDRPVVSINGDGGFGFCLNELATMAQHGIAAIAIVFTDDAFGNVRRIQQEQFGGRTIASDLKNPNFLKLAEAFGVVGRHVDTPEKLRTAVEESILANEPTLIAVPIGPVPNPWTVLGVR
jgi:acetolactate synthase I/II/III large subunit